MRQGEKAVKYTDSWNWNWTKSNFERGKGGKGEKARGRVLEKV